MDTIKINGEEYARVPTNVRGLFEYLKRVPESAYAKYPFLDRCKTRNEALAFLQGLMDKGVLYI